MVGLYFVGQGDAMMVQTILDKPINDSEVTRKFYYDNKAQPDPGAGIGSL